MRTSSPLPLGIYTGIVAVALWNFCECCITFVTLLSSELNRDNQSPINPGLLDRLDGNSWSRLWYSS